MVVDKHNVCPLFDSLSHVYSVATGKWSENRRDRLGSINSQNNINIQRENHTENGIDVYILQGTTTFWKVGKSCSWHTIAVYWFLGFVYE